jgi:hypothetical protein
MVIDPMATTFETVLPLSIPKNELPKMPILAAPDRPNRALKVVKSPSTSVLEQCSKQNKSDQKVT